MVLNRRFGRAQGQPLSILAVPTSGQSFDRPRVAWLTLCKLFKRQTEYFDEPSLSLTPVQIREKLVQLAEPLLTGEQVVQLKELLKLNGWSGTPNSGTGVTEDLKYNSQ